MRTSREINDQVNRAQDQIDEGTSTVPGMSYEEGVVYALQWVTGDSDDLPMEDD